MIATCECVSLQDFLLKACRVPGGPPHDRQCHRCGRVGHFVENCPMRRIAQAVQEEQQGEDANKVGGGGGRQRRNRDLDLELRAEGCEEEGRGGRERGKHRRIRGTEVSPCVCLCECRCMLQCASIRSRQRCDDCQRRLR